MLAGTSNLDGLNHRGGCWRKFLSCFDIELDGVSLSQDDLRSIIDLMVGSFDNKKRIWRHFMRLISLTCSTVLALVLIWPGSVWSDGDASEEEVWAFIKECSQASKSESESFHDCFHEDFLGWQNSDLVPRTAKANRAFTQLQFETTDILAQDLRPIGLRVFGNFAVAHYYVQSIERDQNGQNIEKRVRWTDVLLKENGRWYWVGDHGGAVTIGQP